MVEVDVNKLKPSVDKILRGLNLKYKGKHEVSLYDVVEDVTDTIASNKDTFDFPLVISDFWKKEIKNIDNAIEDLIEQCENLEFWNECLMDNILDG